MPQSPFKKLLLVMVLAATGIALLLQLVNSRLGPQAQSTGPKTVGSDAGPAHDDKRLPPKISRAPEAQPDDEAEPVKPKRITREQAEAWLAKHNRNAMSLLAAFRAMGDTNYLNEAATNFPNDTHVELTILSRDAFPAERRKWLDLFKASSPSNSMADYFSAEDHFKNGKPEEAVQELLAASGKSEFDSHIFEIQLDAEQLYRDSGKSASDVATDAMSDMSEEDIPELATMKKAALGIHDLMREKSGAGDTDSVVHLAQMGLMLSDKLNSGDSGKVLINQLVGNSTKAVAIAHLDQNLAYDFLDGQTPAQVLQQIKEQKKPLRELSAKFFGAYPQMTEAEMASYHLRSMIYGEVPAMKWVVEQHPPADPAK